MTLSAHRKLRIRSTTSFRVPPRESLLALTDDVILGVTIAPKGFWPKLSPGGRNVNWTTSDGLTDFGLQAVYHSNMVRLRPATEADLAASAVTVASVAD